MSCRADVSPRSVSHRFASRPSATAYNCTTMESRTARCRLVLVPPLATVPNRISPLSRRTGATLVPVSSAATALFSAVQEQWVATAPSAEALTAVPLVLAAVPLVAVLEPASALSLKKSWAESE